MALIVDAGAMGQECARLSGQWLARQTRQLMLQGQLGNEAPVLIEEGALRRHDSLCAAARSGLEGGRQIFRPFPLQLDHPELQPELPSPLLQVTYNQVALVPRNTENDGPRYSSHGLPQNPNPLPHHFPRTRAP